MKRFSARTTRKKMTQRGPGQNPRRWDVVGDDPRGAGGGVASSRLSPLGGIALRYFLRGGPNGARQRRVRGSDDLGVSSSTALIAIGAFLASGVEMVEALTIVLGVGVVRG